jgi:hypothetical protein
LPPPPDTQAESATTIAHVDARRRIVENCMGCGLSTCLKNVSFRHGDPLAGMWQSRMNGELTCRSPERGGTVYMERFQLRGGVDGHRGSRSPSPETPSPSTSIRPPIRPAMPLPICPVVCQVIVVPDYMATNHISGVSPCNNSR